MNYLRTAILLAGLTALFMAVGFLIGGKGGMMVALLLAAGMNFFAYWGADKAVLAMHGAQEVDAATAPDLYRLVGDLARRAGLPMPKVYICPHDAPNAFATGRSPRKAAVAVTQGLLQVMDRDELAGVIAHELAHVKNRDTLISCIAATIAGVLAMIAQSFFWFGGGRREGGHPLLGLLTVILAAVSAAMIKAMISRSREFIADADGSVIAGSTHGLASALGKLESYSKRIPLEQPNPAQNNLFIIEPFSASRSLMNLFASHPPTAARIAALQRIEM